MEDCPYRSPENGNRANDHRSVAPGDYERKRDERLVDSGQPGNRNIIYLLAREPSNLENLLEEMSGARSCIRKIE